MHVAKYTTSQLGQMCKHYNREGYEERNYSNENIDKSKTELNYNLAPERNISEVEFIRQRVEEVKHLNRADVVKMADWVVTLPQDYQGDQARFFEESYRALENRYGRENVVSAYVHLDEKTPHMHFAFVPITRTLDKDGQQIEKLSAKEVLTRQELREIHPQMERYLEKRLQEPVHLLNGQTRDGNKAIKELKQETAIKDLERVKTLENVRAVEPKEIEPRNGLRGQYVPFEIHKQVVEQYNALLYQKERELSEERQKTSHLCDRLDRAEKTAKGEHELRLELQDRLQDKEYLKEHIREMERDERAEPQHIQSHKR